MPKLSSTVLSKAEIAWGFYFLIHLDALSLLKTPIRRYPPDIALVLLHPAD